MTTLIDSKTKIGGTETHQFEDLCKLEGCIQLQKQYEKKIEEIEAELDLSNPKSNIRSTLNQANQGIRDIKIIYRKTDEVSKSVTDHLFEVDEVKSTLENYIKQLKISECAQQYLKVLLCIEMLSKDLEAQLLNNDQEQCTTSFANITEICRHLANTPAIHLRTYLKETVYYWYSTLKDIFARDFEEVSKAIKWPFVNVNFSMEVPSEVNIKKLQVAVEYLLQIDLPEELALPSKTPDFPHLSLPMQFLIEPLRKRFLYHFYGSRKTNRIDKPEWYFTKILSWIRDHNEFVEIWIQPVVDKIGLYQIGAKIELMRGLVRLAVEKLYSDLPALQDNDFLFSHCIDEALGFDKELRETYEYPTTEPGILIVLTQAPVFVRWMSMEKKFALEKMDVMLSESFNDEYQSLTAHIENLKITPCAEIFITLLQTITERYEGLPQPGHRLQFLDLQLELLDDFRVRLLQLSRVENIDDDVVNSRISTIANTMYYIENVLIDWGSMLHFLNLYYYKSQLEKSKVNAEHGTDIDMETVFAETLCLYRHMKNDLLMTLVDSVIMKVKKVSRNYRHEMWSTIVTPKDNRSFSLTPTACSTFEILATKLHQLEKYLTDRLFTIVWRLIAQCVDTFLFEELVLENRFSDGGAKQFKFDITRNLFPLFSQYTDKPENYCTQVNEAAALLTISKGSALLLRETLIALEGATGVEDRRGQALKEVGVMMFSPKDAVSVLNRRTDITINRVSSID